MRLGVGRGTRGVWRGKQQQQEEEEEEEEEDDEEDHDDFHEPAYAYAEAPRPQAGMCIDQAHQSGLPAKEPTNVLPRGRERHTMTNDEEIDWRQAEEVSVGPATKDSHGRRPPCVLTKTIP